MTLLKLRPGSIVTLPDELRDALRVADGDEIDARVEGETVVLRRAGEGSPTFAELRARLRPAAEQTAKPLATQEEEILAVVDEARRELAADARRRR